MNYTPNLNLILTPENDTSTYFKEWRTKMNGEQPDSNMMIIDKAFAALKKGALLPYPEGVSLDDIDYWSDESHSGIYLIKYKINEIEAGHSILHVSRGVYSHPEIGDLGTVIQVVCQLGYSGYAVLQRYCDIYDEWSQWEDIHNIGVKGGDGYHSVRGDTSSAGAKAFTLINHNYTSDDILNHRYYLAYVTELMDGAPFSIKLGENYDFVGTITGVYKNKSDDGGYITVDNYIEPNAKDSNGKIDSRTEIVSDSCILLPYDEVNTTNTSYLKDGILTIGLQNFYKLGDKQLGAGAAALGSMCYAHQDGAFTAGYKNIAAGKYSGTLGRYNAMGYCDFGFGQNLKFFGHWNGGFGRDNYIGRLADFCFVGGRAHELYASYTSALGLGHILRMPFANARGQYSEDDFANRYVDRVGWGSETNPKNIYTLDTSGNVWFKGEIRSGASNYDDAGRLSKTFTINSLEKLTKLDAKVGDTAIYLNTQNEYWCRLGADYESNGITLKSFGSTADGYTVDTEIGGKQCRMIPSMSEHPSNRDTRFMYFQMDDYKSATSEITFKITYYDFGTEALQIQYNAANGAVSKAAHILYRTNTNRWKEATVTISDAAFVHASATQSCDFRIGGTFNDSTYIADVEVVTHTSGSVSGKNLSRDIYVLTNGDKSLKNWVLINK